ncbi:MAG: DUF2490 domain-containing protein [Candidatus Sericytochromatia bacterium]|nr:DUF2490 domain-containing protein [Candidatus Sericytochromatia bacterium]
MLSEPEAWVLQEVCLPITERAPVTDQLVQWRLLTELRQVDRYGGLGGLFLRTGVLWTLSPEWMLATQVAAIPNQVAPGQWEQEYRAEIEPNQMGRWGDWVWNDRHRLEWRHRIVAGEQIWHYRNQLRLMYAPDGVDRMPFAWLEPIFDADPTGFAAGHLGVAQVRSQAGISRRLGKAGRLDFGLMVRSQFRQSNWAHDPVLNLALLYVPRGQPLGADGPAPS